MRANLSTLLDEEKLTTVAEDTTADERLAVRKLVHICDMILILSLLLPPPNSTSSSQQLARDTMMEFDWCVQKLETVDRVKMGSLAQDKFQRVMSRELSQLSERSLSGHRVAEWVQGITRSGMEVKGGREGVAGGWYQSEHRLGEGPVSMSTIDDCMTL